MASPKLPEALRTLVLSASDLRLLTNWHDVVIEDYINTIGNLLTLSSVINQKEDILKSPKMVDPSASPYSIRNEDSVIFFDTTAGDIEAFLPIGVDGRTYRLVNVGTGGNRVNIHPDGAETIFGASDEYLADVEAFIITFSSSAGWQ